VQKRGWLSPEERLPERLLTCHRSPAREHAVTTALCEQAPSRSGTSRGTSTTAQLSRAADSLSGGDSARAGTRPRSSRTWTTAEWLGVGVGPARGSALRLTADGRERGFVGLGAQPLVSLSGRQGGPNRSRADPRLARLRSTSVSCPRQRADSRADSSRRRKISVTNVEERRPRDPSIRLPLQEPHRSKAAEPTIRQAGTAEECSLHRALSRTQGANPYARPDEGV
jgi:hypothetical protein